MRQSIRPRVMRRAPELAVVVALMATATGACSNEPTATPTPTVSSSRPTIQPVASWESQFSREQLDAFGQALAGWSSYKQAIQPHNAAGVATPAAKKVYQEFVIPWQVYFQRLERNQSAGVRIARQAEVLDSKATRIVLDESGSSVTIEECVDATDIGATQDGKPVANAFDNPQLTSVVMAEVANRWMVSDIPSTTEDRPCDAPG